MKRRIILSGVHGVGKGYFISHKLQQFKNISIISASEILSRHRNVEDAGNKRVKDVDGNQELIFSAVRDYLKCCDKTLVLDGHLVILDSKDQIRRISKEFFNSSMFNTILLLQDDSEKIYERMYKRDGIHKLSIELIENIQQAEKMYAEELSALGVEIIFCTPNNDEKYKQLFE